MIFIDEIDSFLRERSSNDHQAHADMKCEFMTLWDGIGTPARLGRLWPACPLLPLARCQLVGDEKRAASWLPPSHPILHVKNMMCTILLTSPGLRVCPLLHYVASCRYG